MKYRFNYTYDGNDETGVKCFELIEAIDKSAAMAAGMNILNRDISHTETTSTETVNGEIHCYAGNERLFRIYDFQVVGCYPDEATMDRFNVRWGISEIAEEPRKSMIVEAMASKMPFSTGWIGESKSESSYLIRGDGEGKIELTASCYWGDSDDVIEWSQWAADERGIELSDADLQSILECYYSDSYPYETVHQSKVVRDCTIDEIIAILDQMANENVATAREWSESINNVITSILDSR